MSSITTYHHPSDGWFHQLGLRCHGIAENVLRSYRPIGFVHVDGAGEVLELEQVVGLIAAAEEDAQLLCATAAAKQRAAYLTEFEAALNQPGGGALVERGRWAGFTLGNSTAWCWNLFQYEPRGIVHPGSQLRQEALNELRSGGLPEVFDYPERARQLEAAGISPCEYRQHREALR